MSLVRRAVVVLVLVVATLGVACGSRLEEASVALSASPQSPPAASATPAAGSDGALSAIVVRTPVSGDELVAPVRVAGIADVFEATVGIRILDSGGRELAVTFATATCGSGCRGRFSTELFFVTEERQNGTIEVFEESAEDGSALNLVSIPVVLVPGS